MAAAETFNVEPVTIKASPRAPKPEEDPLTQDQWRTLLAIADTVVPAIVEQSKGTVSFKAIAVEPTEYARAVTAIEKHALRQQRTDFAIDYLKERPSQLPAFKEAVWRFLALNTPQDQLKAMRMGLNLLQ
jgi:hypothetical protein